MNIKKILSLTIVGLVAMLAINGNVKAADTVTLKCNKTEIKIGESTTCEVDATLASAPSAATLTIANSQYLTISAVTANSTVGWALSKTNNDSTYVTTYSFNNSTSASVPLNTSTAVMSFTVTLSTEAKNLASTDNCGQICISAATFDGAALTSVGSGVCYTPTVTIEDCTGTGCNATTGAFLNYALLGGGAAIALGAIVIARRNNKFYKI
jgi:hypothetical protein